MPIYCVAWSFLFSCLANATFIFPICFLHYMLLVLFNKGRLFGNSWGIYLYVTVCMLTWLNCFLSDAHMHDEIVGLVFLMLVFVIWFYLTCFHLMVVNFWTKYNASLNLQSRQKALADLHGMQTEKVYSLVIVVHFSLLWARLICGKKICLLECFSWEADS